MVINFRFKNCRSFYEETDLSMRATTDTQRSETNTFFVNENTLTSNDRELLKSAVIFGANASGKSNILKAFSYMVNVVKLSSAQIPIVAGNQSFAFNDNAKNQNSLYEVEFIQNNIYYRYGFELLKGYVKHEWLYKREKREAKVFERTDEKLEISGLSAQAIRLIKIPYSTLFVSVGNNFNLPINNHIFDVLQWFNSVIIVFENNANLLDIYTYDNGKYKNLALQILKKADIGITNFDVVKDKIARSGRQRR